MWKKKATVLIFWNDINLEKVDKVTPIVYFPKEIEAESQVKNEKKCLEGMLQNWIIVVQRPNKLSRWVHFV